MICFAIGVAVAGVLFLTLQYGRVPWIALTLACTFGIYGLLRKTARAESMVGLLLDAGILTPMALVYLIKLGVQRSGAFVSLDLQTFVLLAGAGVVTVTSLLLFAHGARRIQYSTLGIFQYIGPTGHLLVGVLLYQESFTRTHAISFGAVWAAIVIYSISSLMIYNKGSAS